MKTNIGIVSLGLIGSSILKGLQGKDYDIFCYSTTLPREAFEYTKNISGNLEILSDCDIVFVASPISKTLEMLKKLNGIVKQSAVVCDCASVKKGLSGQTFEYDFILTHPMAGSEKSGFSAGTPDLFKGAKWLIERHNPLLEKVIQDLGAQALKIDMKNHDKMCAKISHMPSLLACALFDATDDESRQIASSGFRDMTRLAASDTKLLVDMFEYNGENIEKAFDDLIDKINHLKNDLKNSEQSEKIHLLRNIALKRVRMYDSNGKNIFKI